MSTARSWSTTVSKKPPKALFGSDLQAITKALENSAPINGLSPLGLTPLGVAAWKGNLEAATLLLQRGADVDAGHASPLWIATMGARDEVCALLHSHGATQPNTLGPFQTPSAVPGQPEQNWTARLLPCPNTPQQTALLSVFAGRILLSSTRLQVPAEIDTARRALTAAASTLTPSPRLRAFTYNEFLYSKPIQPDELDPFTSQAPWLCQLSGAMTGALTDNDAERIRELLNEIKLRWPEHLAYQQTQVQACPLCSRLPYRFSASYSMRNNTSLLNAGQALVHSASPFGDAGGESNGTFRCWCCHMLYHHQHEYEYDPGGSWDDHYYIRLNINEVLETIQEMSASDNPYTRKRTHGHLRLAVYAVLRLCWDA